MSEDSGSLPSKINFSEWYNEILWQAEIMDVRYPVKGLYVWFPHGFFSSEENSVEDFTEIDGEEVENLAERIFSANSEVA